MAEHLKELSFKGLKFYVKERATSMYNLRKRTIATVDLSVVDNFTPSMERFRFLINEFRASFHMAKLTARIVDGDCDWYGGGT